MLIVFNPAAGQRQRRRLDGLLAALATRGVTAEVQATRQAGEASELARAAARAGVPLVIAAGGDGTIAEVVNGLLDGPVEAKPPALGIVPLGTANVLAQELAIPRAPAALADLLTSDTTRPLWSGVLEHGQQQRYFVQMVGAGFDACVVHGVNGGLKRLVGGLAYGWQGLVEAGRYGFPRIDVVIDGVPMTTHGIIVTKGRLYAGRFTLAPEASPFERGFTAVLFDRPGALSALAFGLALPLGQVARLPGIRWLPAREVQVLAGKAPVQVDGDPLADSAFAVRTSSRSLDVLAP